MEGKTLALTLLFIFLEFVFILEIRLSFAVNKMVFSSNPEDYMFVPSDVMSVEHISTTYFCLFVVQSIYKNRPT